MIEHEFHTAQNEFKPFDMIVHIVSYELSRWKKAHVAHTDFICESFCHPLWGFYFEGLLGCNT